MKENQPTYDVAIIGGGLAGLCLSIQLSWSGIKVLLLEKEQYPFHKVCGEYISMESWGFLEQLGVPLTSWNLPHIHQLRVSDPKGNLLTHQLDLGGFGVSRYKLDAELASIATSRGVTIVQGCKVHDVHAHAIYTSSGMFQAEMVVGSWGKRSRMDAVLVRDFLQPHQRSLTDYVGIKYHVHADLPADTIELHNFRNGYCGISKIENDTYCMCYLVKGTELKKAGGQIPRMEKEVLHQNPFLKKYFETFPSAYMEPLAISQISFEHKTQREGQIAMIGDAAGLITPLCGNGMSMAMHASHLLAIELTRYFGRQQSYEESLDRYEVAWRKQFSGRLRAGRMIQSLFGDPTLTGITLSLLKRLPPLTSWLIKQTHGKPF